MSKNLSPSTESPPLEPQCVYHIPLSLKIPREGRCPILNKGRNHFYRQVRKQIYLQLPLAGARQGPGDVFGPSVCDAKFGCICGLRPALEQIRAKLKIKPKQA
jgi:hypothetical protein